MRAAFPLLLLLLAVTPAAAQEVQGFRVVNRAGAEAMALFAVRAGRGADNAWGNNLLRPDRPLAENGGFRVVPNAEAGCRFDLRLVLRDGREAVLTDRDICAEREIEVLSARPVPPRGAAGSAGGPMAGPAGRDARPVEPSQQVRQVSSGTGFLVADARVLTNHHVIARCDRVLLRAPTGHWLEARPPARTDPALDLAVLNVPGLAGPALAFRTSPATRRGEGVVAYGFPLAGLLSSDPKLTRGEINGLRGLGDNPSQYQISAEVQPGNSGGPLVDMRGNVVGVVVSKLNAQAVSRRTGDIAQNVNFAVQGGAALEFLRRAEVPVRAVGSDGPDRPTADVGEILHRSTLFIRCER